MSNIFFGHCFNLQLHTNKKFKMSMGVQARFKKTFPINEFVKDTIQTLDFQRVGQTSAPDLRRVGKAARKNTIWRLLEMLVRHFRAPP